MNLKGKGDFTDAATVVYIHDLESTQRFAKAAAAHFASHPEHWTYSDAEIDPQLLGIRWGLHKRAVFVCRVDEGFRPVIFGDIVAEAPKVDAVPEPRLRYKGTDDDSIAMKQAIQRWANDQTNANWWVMIGHISAWQAWLASDETKEGA